MGDLSHVKTMSYFAVTFIDISLSIWWQFIATVSNFFSMLARALCLSWTPLQKHLWEWVWVILAAVTEKSDLSR